MTIVQMQYYRRKKGYSYKKLAEVSGVPLSTVQKIFGGLTRTPRYETLQALERALLPGDDEDCQNVQALREECIYGTHLSQEHGDYKTLEDYYALPEDRRVELIDGVFYDMAAPRTSHQTVLLTMWSIIDSFISSQKGSCVPFAAPTDVQLDNDEYTMVQPDVFVVCDRNKITGRCVIGAPDFVTEILSDSTRKKDMTRKLAKYEEAGVREYWMVDLENERILVYDMSNETSLLRIYGLRDKIPVGIFQNQLVIDFAKIMDKVLII